MRKAAFDFSCTRAKKNEKKKDMPPRSLPKPGPKRQSRRLGENTVDAQGETIVVEDEEPAEGPSHPIGENTPLGSASSKQQTSEQAEEEAEANIDAAATAVSGLGPTSRVEVARCQSLERGRGPLTEPGEMQRILVGAPHRIPPNTVLMDEEITGCRRYHPIPQREGGQDADIPNAILDAEGRWWDLDFQWKPSTTSSHQKEICLLPNGYCKEYGLLAGDTVLCFTDSEGKLRISHTKARSGGLSLRMEHEPQGSRQRVIRSVRAPEGVPTNYTWLNAKFLKSPFDGPPMGHIKLDDRWDLERVPTYVLDQHLRVWDFGVRQDCVSVSRDSHLSKPDKDFFLPWDFFKANDVREGDYVRLRTDADRFLRIFHERTEMPSTSSRSGEVGVTPPAPSGCDRPSAPS
eukprot:jgi/Botrbrau1/15342/Bobra.0147s0007.1